MGRRHRAANEVTFENRSYGSTSHEEEKQNQDCST
jgi:hypothetical protein